MSAPGETLVLAALLDSDHEVQHELMERMSVDYRSRVLLLPVLASLLIAHLAAERAAVHPVADEVGSDPDLLAASAEEHRKMDGMLHALFKAEPTGLEFDQELHELAGLHASHVQVTAQLATDVVELVSTSRLPGIGAHFLSTRALWLAPKPGYQHVWEI